MSPYIMKAGISLPLHPFFVEVLDALNIAPLPLSPNAWRCMVGILLFYTECGLGTPSLQEFFYMFTLKPGPNHDGFFYFAPWFKHRGLPITNNVSNAGDYKTRYFFVKDRRVNGVFRKPSKLCSAYFSSYLSFFILCISLMSAIHFNIFTFCCSLPESMLQPPSRSPK